MGIIVEVGVNPISLPCAAEAIVEGKVYKDDGSGRMTVSTAANDSIVAIALESSLDSQTAAAKTLAAGDEMKFAMIGSGMIVGVCAENTTAFQKHAAVYNMDTGGTSGYCQSANNNSATKIGHYMGKDNYTTGTAGEMLAVQLDVAPIA